MSELYKIYSIIQVFVYRFCLPLAVDSKVGHYIRTVAHHVNLPQLCTATERLPHFAVYLKNTLLHLPEAYQKPLKYRYLHVTDTQR